jgi:hypothetical protein
MGRRQPIAQGVDEGLWSRRVVLEVLEAGTTTRAATVLLGQAVGRAQLDGEGERGGGES